MSLIQTWLELADLFDTKSAEVGEKKRVRHYRDGSVRSFCPHPSWMACANRCRVIVRLLKDGD